MVFLLDTNVISDLMREHPAVVAHLSKSSASDRIVTCTIVRGQILHGLARLAHGKRKEALEEFYTKFEKDLKIAEREMEDIKRMEKPTDQVCDHLQELGDGIACRDADERDG